MFIAGAGTTNIDLLYEGMERIPNSGEEVFSKGFSLQLGGGIPATLINLSRLGFQTKIATQLGTDIFSEFAKSEFKKAGAEIVNLYNGDEIPITVTSAVILPQDRTFFSYCGSKEPDDKMKETFYQTAKGSKITLMETSGYIEVYKKLKDDGTILVLDTGWHDNLSYELYKEYIELADYYTPNRLEAMKLTGKSTPQEAAKELSSRLEKVIVKLDSEGCLCIENGREFLVPSIKEFVRVDSTGAGDAFLAGLCYGIFYGYSFEESVQFGCITGGKAVTKTGALSAYVTESELLSIAKR